MLLEFLYDNTGNKFQTDIIYSDFSKAFDKISYNILLRKPAELGVGVLPMWIDSYIKNSSQYVYLSGFTSTPYVITSGVPQGSHSDPLFFMIYISEIKDCFKHAQYGMCADDHCKIESISNCKELQSDINTLFVFCTRNKVVL